MRCPKRKKLGITASMSLGDGETVVIARAFIKCSTSHGTVENVSTLKIGIPLLPKMNLEMERGNIERL